MITLLGVGHVFDIKNAVENAILKRNPSLICLELDELRFNSLLNKGQKKKSPFFYRILASFQEKAAEEYGTEVGEEMLSAINTARKINAKISLIDMDARDMLKRILKYMSFKERIKFIISIFAGFFVKKEKIEEEMKRYEQNQSNYIEEFGKEFPTIKRILIDERNQFMANAIKKLSEEHKNMVVVIGDGHIEGLKVLLAEKEIEVIRLGELRNFDEKREGQNITYTYTWQ